MAVPHFFAVHRNRIRWTAVNLGRLQEWVDAGRLDTGRVLTMRDLRDNGVVHKKIPHGVKLLAKARWECCSRCFARRRIAMEVGEEGDWHRMAKGYDKGVHWLALPPSGCPLGQMREYVHTAAS